jgi:DNA-binding IclR family transcriptional regulator
MVPPLSADAESGRNSTSPAHPQQSRYTIQVLAKALDLLDVLAPARSGLTLAELCVRLDLPKSSVFRYLATLETRGYVERINDSDKYLLGLKLFELGSLVASHFDVGEASLPLMHGLLEQFGETVNLGIMHDAQVFYLQILEGTRSMRMAAQPGVRNLPHCTALGKAILAHLPDTEVQAIVTRNGLPALTPRTITTIEQLHADLEQIRRRGYAIDDIENEDGVRCVAAPIFDHRGQVIAAVSVSGPAARVSPSQVEVMGRELVAGAREVSWRLGNAIQP